MQAEIWQNLSVGAIIVGVDQSIRMINRKAAQIYGLDPRAVTGQGYAKVFLPLIKDARFQQLHKIPIVQSLNTGQYINYSLQAQTVKGQPLLVECSISPIKNNAGKVIGAIELHTLPNERSAAPAQSAAQNAMNQNLMQFVSRATLGHIRSVKAAGEITALKRYKTVVFIDIVGFTSWAEKLDPHGTVSVLNLFFKRVHKTITRYKGDIDKFLGDALLMTFDNGENAVRCSTDIILMDIPIVNSQIAKDYPEVGELQIHVGINSGWVICGELGATGRKDFTVIGDDVNIAARIQNLSPPNEIFISGKTAGNLGEFRNLFEFAEYMKVKGKDQQLNVYKLDPRRLKVNKRVFLYEKNKAIRESMVEKLRNLGVEETTAAGSADEIKAKLGGSHETMFLGPSTAMNELAMIKNMAQQAGFGKDIMIPVSKDVSPSSIAALEKMGIKTYIPYNDGEGLGEAMGNAMRMQNLSTVPKAGETKAATEQPAETPTAPQAQEGAIGVEDGYAFRLEPQKIRISIEKKLLMPNLQSLMNSIYKVWSIEYQSRNDVDIIFDFDNIELSDFDEGSVKSLLNAIARHEKLGDGTWREKPVLIKSSQDAVRETIEKLSEAFPVKLAD